MMVSTPNHRKKVGAADASATFRTSFGERLAVLLNLFESRAAASQVAEVNQDMFAKYIDGRAKPRLEVVARLAAAKSVSLDWLVTGQGDLAHGEPAGNLEEFALVPVWNAEASSGFGAFVDLDSVGGQLAFSRIWLRTTHASAEKNLYVVFNRGDSNEPDIRHGEAMLVDRGVTVLKDDAFYVFDREGMLLVKMIERTVGGTVILKARNPRYSEQTLSPEEAAAITVFGRVIWRGGLL